MIVLPSTDALQFVIDSGGTGTSVKGQAYYIDNPGDTIAPHKISSNGVTAVSLVAAPASGFQRLVKEASIYNADTVAHTVTVQIYDGSATWVICSFALAPGASLMYAPEMGWQQIPSTTAIRGVTDGSNAGAGIVGEYLESVESPATVHAAPATNQYFDLTSLTLSAGDWDVTAVTLGRPNGAMNGALGVSCYMGIGRVAGNNNTGLVQSKNAVNVDCGTATSYVTLPIPSYRMNITAADVSGGTNIAYIKALMTYLSGAPGFVGYRLSARRVR